MPILGIAGNIVPKKGMKQHQSNKKKAYKGKRVEAMKHHNNMSESQAKYLTDLRIAKQLRDMYGE